jgi:pyridoxamine 5'-phosphate oxidase
LPAAATAHPGRSVLIEQDPDSRRPARCGFRVLPDRVEFWQESPDGLHDRIRYRRASKNWTIERLSP